jgi:hypothetical protein
VCFLVPLFEHGRDAIFPIPAPGSVMVTVPAAMPHAAEEDQFHQTEDEEEEEDGAADRAEWEEELPALRRP